MRAQLPLSSWTWQRLIPTTFHQKKVRQQQQLLMAWVCWFRLPIAIWVKIRLNFKKALTTLDRKFWVASMHTQMKVWKKRSRNVTHRIISSLLSIRLILEVWDRPSSPTKVFLVYMRFQILSLEAPSRRSSALYLWPVSPSSTQILFKTTLSLNVAMKRASLIFLSMLAHLASKLTAGSWVRRACLKTGFSGRRRKCYQRALSTKLNLNQCHQEPWPRKNILGRWNAHRALERTRNEFMRGAEGTTLYNQRTKVTLFCKKRRSTSVQPAQLLLNREKLLTEPSEM
jgi:hypothetical protein